MLRGWVLGCVIGFAVLAPARVAHALCVPPQTAVSPRAGTRLPPNPTLYLIDVSHTWFLRGELAVTVDDDDDAPHAVPYLATEVASTGNYALVRLDLDTGARGAGTIELTWRGELLAIYPLGDAAPDRARVVDVARFEDRSSCEDGDGIAIAVDSHAAAYRLAWDDGHVTVIPADTRDSLRSDGRPGIALGWDVCDPFVVPIDTSAHVFRLDALFADGTARAMGAAAVHFDPSHEEVRLPFELVGREPPPPRLPWSVGWELLNAIGSMIFFAVWCPIRARSASSG